MSDFLVDGVALGSCAADLRARGWAQNDESRLLERGAGKVYLDATGRARLVCGQMLSCGDELLLVSGQQLDRARSELFAALSLPPCLDPGWLCSWQRPRALFFPAWNLTVSCESGKFHSATLGASGGTLPEHVSRCELEWPRRDSRHQAVTLHASKPGSAPEVQWLVGSAWVGAPAGMLGALGWKARSRHPDGSISFRSEDGRFGANARGGRVRRVSGPTLGREGQEVLRQGEAVSPDWREVFKALGLPYPEEDRERFSSDPPGLVHFQDWKLSIFMSSEVCGIVLEDGGGRFELGRGVSGYGVTASDSHYRSLRFHFQLR